MSTVLVVGGTGTVGSEIAKNLKAKGHKVFVTTSKKNKNPDQVYLNLVDQGGLDKAFDGIDKMFLLSPPGYTEQDKLLGPVIEKAKSSGVKKIVLMTAMGVNADDNAPLRKVEIKLERSGIAYNIIRPNWFMQNFNSYWIQTILSHGKILLPVAEAKGSFIDARDIASVATELLVSNKFDNQAFDLTGAEAINHNKVAEILTNVTGKKIIFSDITPGEMLEGLLHAGLPRPYSEFMLVILDFFKQGYSERTTDAVEKITGQKPIKFEKYAMDYRSFWMK